MSQIVFRAITPKPDCSDCGRPSDVAISCHYAESEINLCPDCARVVAQQITALVGDAR